MVSLTDTHVTVGFERNGEVQRKVFSRWAGRESQVAQLAPAGNEVRYSAELGASYLTMEVLVRRGELALEQVA